jgi:hypothetical protein
MSEELGNQTILKILEGLMQSGKLIIIGLPQQGKTTTAMHIIRKLTETKEFQEGVFLIKVCDTANVWKWRFDKIPYIDLTKTHNIPEIERILLLDLGYTDNKINTSLIESMVRGDYYRQREMINKLEGRINIRRIYVIEEIQNILGTYSMNGESGRFWLKEISEGANYGQYIIGLGQRLSDISTKIVERCRYFLIGALTGDNDLAKLKRMLGSEKANVLDLVRGLKKGEFLWLDKENPEGSMKIYFPIFVQNGKPYEYGAKQNGKITAERVFV